jgi:ribosomal protein S18 acetylase RimI-like enzyme
MLPPTYQISPAGWKDLNQLRVIERECFELDAWPLFDLIGVLTFPGIVRLKVVVDDVMVAFAAGDDSRSDEVGWISTIGVLPAYRKMGIGEALLAACEEQMHTRVIQLTVRKSNQAAIRMYEKSGYSQIEIWERYYTGGEDGVVMRKVRA